MLGAGRRCLAEVPLRVAFLRIKVIAQPIQHILRCRPERTWAGFLYATPRYSEDPNFALERAPDQYHLPTILKMVRPGLTAADVRPFLESGDAANLLMPDNLTRVLLGNNTTEAAKARSSGAVIAVSLK
jgi:hypothetical protein